MDRQLILNILLGLAIMQFVWQPIAALIAERLSATIVMLGGLVFALVMVIPFFLAIVSANPVAITITLYLTTLGGSAYYALLATFLAGAFPTNVRYTGVSASYQLCATFIGGSTPLIAQALLTATGPWGVGVFFALMLIATIGGVSGLAALARRREARAPVAEPAVAAR
ncbi:hypothetical protein [Leifsonia sp. NPDC080035]|uniref:Major facilitator superfamily (MFS) profile domain-containing protein n=1 Tax=Leifsonia sp. NPDC080035 TaxID=3143936 RepID=A0AAU7GF41_9MICO